MESICEQNDCDVGSGSFKIEGCEDEESKRVTARCYDISFGKYTTLLSVAETKLARARQAVLSPIVFSNVIKGY